MPLNCRFIRDGCSSSTCFTILPLTFLLVVALAAPSLSVGADKKVDMAPRDAKEPVTYPESH